MTKVAACKVSVGGKLLHDMIILFKDHHLYSLPEK